MEGTDVATCKNCGADARSKFCSECGQNTAVSVPTLSGLFHEVFAAVLSYDSRLWRTLRTLVTRPGELTVRYIEGARAQYSTPFQLFIWLQAITFVVNRFLFDTDPHVSDAKSRDLLLVGACVAILLCILNAPQRRKVIENIVCVTHLWSFLMLVLLFEYATLPLVAKLINLAAPNCRFYMGYTATAIAIGSMLIYTPISLARVFGDRWWVAALKTILIIVAYYFLQHVFDRYLHPTISI